ncbi:KilA-N domain protein [Sodalis glossinidius str. 'morsitans']|uniref:KilA-N domain protein n=1 Tax=Sodalis glossinidius (strain morsitans) TaxID=343509 RepID=A0A193QM55_SODGM|nr:KilA-N domain-containing protein [Sodalis glossinidius]CRL46246.1 KilA-N domain protein [Sodalis glossinidius str. 'morsitans']
MSKIVVIENTVVRQDAFGRYCLNDLHKAAGNIKKDSPAYWLANKQTQELIAQFLSEDGIPVSVIRGSPEQGTYVAKELVFAYAMWISAAFNLKVIRTFDKATSAPAQPLTDQLQTGLALLSFAKQEFRLAPSAVLGSLQQLQTSCGLPNMLPAYAVDAPEGSTTGSSEVTHSLTELLPLHGKPYTAQSGFKRLQLLGLVERKSRPSTKHPDREKMFWSLTEKGLQFGKNLTDPANPRQTQLHFYDSQFPRLLAVMANGAAA